MLSKKYHPGTFCRLAHHGDSVKRRNKHDVPQLVGQDGPSQLVGQEDPTQLVGQEGPSPLVGREGLPQMVGQEGTSPLVGLEGPSLLVGQEVPPQLVGQQGTFQLVGEEQYHTMLVPLNPSQQTDEIDLDNDGSEELGYLTGVTCKFSTNFFSFHFKVKVKLSYKNTLFPQFFMFFTFFLKMMTNKNSLFIKLPT